MPVKAVGVSMVLADRFDQVTVLDRDDLPGRRRIPQPAATRNGNEPACPSRPGKGRSIMAEDLPVDPEALRAQVRGKYREVAVDPGASFHFHTGRDLAMRLSYDAAAVAALAD